MPARHQAILLGIAFFAGGNFIAAKLVVNELPAVFSSALRFALAFILLLPFLKVQRGRMKAVLMTALNTSLFNFALIYEGFNRTDDVSAAAIVGQIVVPISTLFAVIFLGERIGWRRISAIAIAFAGVLVLGLDPKVFSYVDGLLFLIGGSTVFAFGLIQIRKLGNVPAMTFLAWQALVAAPGQFLLSLWFEEGQWQALSMAAPTALWGLAYTVVISTFVVHAGFYYVVQRNPISDVMPYTLLTPVIAIFYSIIAFDEVLSERMILGALLTLGGVAVITLRNREEIAAIGASDAGGVLDTPAPIPEPLAKTVDADGRDCVGEQAD